jgi:ankyrin repeat protein
MKNLFLTFFIGIIAITNIEAQPSVEKQYTKFTRCINNSNIAKAQKLLNKGFQVDAKEITGKTPLLYSIQVHNFEFAKFFIEKGANIQATDNDGNTSLHYAIANNEQNKIAYFLIDKGVKIEQANKNGETPFHYSLLYSCNELPFYLIEKGADINKMTSFNENALHLSAESGCDTITNYLINKGLDINLIDAKGNSPLYKALMGNHSVIAENFIKMGADVNLVNNEGNNSLFYTINNNDTYLTKLLLDKGVSIEQKSTQEPYLYVAADNSNEAIIEALLLNGAKNPMRCDVHDECYKTAFIYSINARIVPEDQKLNYYQNSLNIYKVAKEKYKNELNKIRAKNTARFCGEVCLIAGSASSYGSPTYYGGGVDYEAERRIYLKDRIEKCESMINTLENTINSISKSPGNLSY